MILIPHLGSRYEEVYVGGMALGRKAQEVDAEVVRVDLGVLTLCGN